MSLLSMFGLGQQPSAPPQSGTVPTEKELPDIQDLSAKMTESQKVAWTKELDESFEQAKAARRPYERQWMSDIAFFVGKQWLQWDPVRQTLLPPAVPPWRVLVTINKIRNIVLSQYSKIIQRQPETHAQAQGDDPESAQKAEAADKLLEYLRDPRTMKRALLWAMVAGTGIIKTYWDAQKGDIVSEDKDGPVYLGDVAIDPVSPFEFYPEPLVEEIEHMGWCFHVKVRTAAYVMDKFGVNVDGEDLSSGEMYEGRLAFMGEEGDMPRSKGVIVKEYWEKPSRRFPKGRYCVYVKDKLLRATDFPYTNIGNVGLPFTSFRQIPVPGRFWGDSSIVDLADVQRNYNKSRSQGIESRNMMSKAQWTAAKGALDPGKPITSAPGLVIEYTPQAGAPDGGRPMKSPGADVPASVFKDLELSGQEFFDVSGQHEVAGKQGMGGLRTGVAIGYLLEQDQIRLGPATQEWEEAYEDIDTTKLRLVKQFYMEVRTIKVVGADNAVETLEFDKETLPSDIAVKVVAGSALPRSRTERNQTLMQLGTLGWIQPDDALGDMELGNLPSAYEEVRRDKKQAQRENLRMKDGDPSVAVHSYDAHARHIKEHNSYRKGEEFEQMDPTIQAAFEAHVLQHQQAALAQPPAEDVATAAAKMSAMQALGTSMGQQMGGGLMAHPEPPPPGGHEALNTAREQTGIPYGH